MYDVQPRTNDEYAVVLAGIGERPYYPFVETTDPRFRNGREAGSWAAGVVHSIPEKCALVEFPADMIDGAVCAMVRLGLTVSGYSSSDDGSKRTLDVRSSYHKFIEQ